MNPFAVVALIGVGLWALLRKGDDTPGDEREPDDVSPEPPAEPPDIPEPPEEPTPSVPPPTEGDLPPPPVPDIDPIEISETEIRIGQTLQVDTQYATNTFEVIPLGGPAPRLTLWPSHQSEDEIASGAPFESTSLWDVRLDSASPGDGFIIVFKMNDREVGREAFRVLDTAWEVCQGIPRPINTSPVDDVMVEVMGDQQGYVLTLQVYPQGQGIGTPLPLAQPATRWNVLLESKGEDAPDWWRVTWLKDGVPVTSRDYTAQKSGCPPRPRGNTPGGVGGP